MATPSRLLALTIAAAGSASAIWRGVGHSESPPYTWIFDFPLPIPAVAQPIYSEVINNTQPVQYYEMTIEKFQKQIYPNLGPANLVGYNGTVPGPTFRSIRGTESVVRVVNNGDLSAALHFHGSWSRSPWDGWASDLMQPGQFKDYYYPATASARTLWYHDHADTHTAVDAYFGQSGFHFIDDPALDYLMLPTGEYDIPLAINDKIYAANGDLVSPAAETVNFFGDIIQVNGQPWPYLQVEPRKYRFRILNSGLSRAYELYFNNDESGQREGFQVIASDGGLFGAPVPSETLILACGERYEVVFDFSAYQNSNITLMNTNGVLDVNEYQNTDKIMRFVVGDMVTDPSNNEVPSTLVPVTFPPSRSTVDHVFNFEWTNGLWTINGVDYDDVNSRVLAKPSQGMVENWELRWGGGPGIHPVHIHLVDFQVVSRTGGSRGVLPYESAGYKDIVLLDPGETVNVLARFGPWNGIYVFHCHNLIHEDHEMMDVFNSTKLADLGYDDVDDFNDPLDTRYSAQDYDARYFTQDYIVNTLLPNLVNSAAYSKTAEITQALEEYYDNMDMDYSESGDSDMPSATASAAASTTSYANGGLSGIGTNHGGGVYSFRTGFVATPTTTTPPAPAKSSSYTSHNDGGKKGGGDSGKAGRPPRRFRA